MAKLRAPQASELVHFGAPPLLRFCRLSVELISRMLLKPILGAPSMGRNIPGRTLERSDSRIGRSPLLGLVAVFRPDIDMPTSHVLVIRAFCASDLGL